MIPRESRWDFSKLAPYLALLAMLVIASATSEHFLQVRNLLNITRQVSYTGIIALGMTFVIIAGGIDLSVGSLVAFSGGVIIMAMNYCFTDLAPGSELAAFLFALATGLALGLLGGVFSGALITQFNLAPFIVTLGFMGFYRSMALYTGNGGEFRVESGMRMFSRVGTGLIYGVPVPSLVFLLLAVVFGIILNWTRFGRYVCAVGSNENVARYAAIRVNRVRTLTYVICGLTVALSAFLLGGRMNSINSTNAGNLYELDAIAAVVIGGTAMTGGAGSMAGTVVGALMLGIINNMLNMWGVSAYLQGAVKGLVIVLAVLVQSSRVRALFPGPGSGGGFFPRKNVRCGTGFLACSELFSERERHETDCIGGTDVPCHRPDGLGGRTGANRHLHPDGGPRLDRRDCLVGAAGGP